MSDPNTKSELHEGVEEYARHFCGQPEIAYYIHEEIDHPEKRTGLYNEYIEYFE